MTMVEQYQKYKAQSVGALTPGEQIVLLFEHAAVNLNKAIAFIEQKDISGAHNAIVRTQDIYQFLSEHLDMRIEISHNLFSLYQYIYDELVKANINKDAEIVKRMLAMTRSFRDTWKQAETLSRMGRTTK
jgi:flagellar secretion chaperone FliS